MKRTIKFRGKSIDNDEWWLCLKAKSERGFSELCYYAPAAFKQCPYYQPKKMKDGK